MYSRTIVKYFAAVFTFALLSSTAALAQVYAPQANFRLTAQEWAQLDQVVDDARSQIESALTPASRSLIAGGGGYLQAFRNLRELDQTLSPAEKQAVLDVYQRARAQTVDLFATDVENMPGLTPEQRVQIEDAQSAARNGAVEAGRQPDPAEVILMIELVRGPTEGLAFLAIRPAPPAPRGLRTASPTS
jgi:hypothetical protein